MRSNTELFISDGAADNEDWIHLPCNEESSRKLFRNRRYCTQGVDAYIPLEVQIYLWTLIDNMKGEDTEIDYLQVFRLSVEDGKQKIIHSQEQPDYRSETIINFTNPVTAKIFVIDDIDYSTMLLAKEY